MQQESGDSYGPVGYMLTLQLTNAGKKNSAVNVVGRALDWESGRSSSNFLLWRVVGDGRMLGDSSQLGPHWHYYFSSFHRPLPLGFLLSTQQQLL